MPIQGILARELSPTPVGSGDGQPEAGFKRTPCNGINSPIILGIFRLRARDGCARNKVQGAPLKMTVAKGSVKCGSIARSIALIVASRAFNLRLLVLLATGTLQ